ncbi:hypothetical protein [Clostridium sp. UBA4548]|uniref:hypothetical protein n=1 Tax=Clostridium sp. UBA4548 TaxID=1946361 RepID=UPI0025C56A82|nr:hypothetical protein [Clostridium sp. UBA4548]
MGFEKSVQDDLLEIYKEPIEENESPNTIRSLIKSRGIADITISAIKENIKFQLGLEWDRKNQKWNKCHQISIFNFNEEKLDELNQEKIIEQVNEDLREVEMEIEKSTLAEVDKSQEVIIEKTKEVDYSVNSVKSTINNIIKNAQLERLSELTLELALDKEAEEIEKIDMEIIINNMRTMLKYMKELQEKMKKISKNFNKLTDAITKHTNGI